MGTQQMKRPIHGSVHNVFLNSNGRKIPIMLGNMCVFAWAHIRFTFGGKNSPNIIMLVRFTCVYLYFVVN